MTLFQIERHLKASESGDSMSEINIQKDNPLFYLAGAVNEKDISFEKWAVRWGTNHSAYDDGFLEEGMASASVQLI
jgi:hypothetical protein